MSDERSSNLLKNEKSPYLLQHADNPVHWHAWSAEAFERARQLDRPVLISIGYATCHWCHVMAHESFEDQAIAEVLNNNFVCIKIDREERPDIDAFYMDVCQAMTGHGGWPLTVFTDTEKRPFFAGTYFPPRAQGNRLGFLDLVQRVSHAWTTDRAQIMNSATQIVSTLQEAASASFRGEVPADVFASVADYHQRSFDETHGGFGQRPKFPSPHHLLALFRIGRRTGNSELTRMAMVTLDAMRAGGIYDHVGFGFHRYSTDQAWVVPHFEKMLYDQAMLMMAYTEAWQISGRQTYQRTVHEMVDYLSREMVGDHGAFFSAQDADSEGVEGKFYVWDQAELKALLSADDVAFLSRTFHVRLEGNFNDEASGNPTGLNILYLDRLVLEQDNADIRSQWEAIRPVLLEARSKRVKPLTDDKVLTDWNGLMIVALARAARALGTPDILSMATTAYAAVTQLCGGDHWVHRYRDGHRSVGAMLDDHAAMGWAAIELYQATGQGAYLADAVTHADTIMANFVGTDGRLCTVAGNNVDVPVQHQSAFDSAYPSGNSVAAMLFTALGAILHNNGYQERARDCVVTYASQLASSSAGFCMLLCAWDTLSYGSTDVVLSGDPNDPFLAEAAALMDGSFWPDAFRVARHDGADRTELDTFYALAAPPQPSVLVCHKNACSSPLITLEALEAHLLEIQPC